MSRGLGELQRRILSNAPTNHWVESGRLRFRLRNDVVDLRAQLRNLANLYNAYSHSRFVEPAFQAAFSRAVRTLVDRGRLERITVVPVSEIDPYRPEAFEHLSDGWYLIWHSEQRRFVRIRPQVA